jgi:GNAT superfamily N-acetyltransferase
LAELPPGALSAVASKWRNERAQLTTSFGGTSMLPTIEPGRVLTVDCGAVPEVGDVVFAIAAERPLVHRVVLRRSGSIITRGDANLLPDFPLAEEAVVGVIHDVGAPAASRSQRAVLALTHVALAVDRRAAKFFLKTAWWLAVRVPDAYRRIGVLGLLKRLYSRTGGYLLEINPVIEWTTPARQSNVTPPAGYRLREVSASESGVIAAAARVLGTRLETRAGQQLFVALDPFGGIAACTWNAPPRPDGKVRHRGVAVDPHHRARGLAQALLLFQASHLAGVGATHILYETGTENRASNAVFHRLGADLKRFSVSFIALRRFHVRLRLGGPFDWWLRRRWVSEHRRASARSSSPR